MIRTDQTGKWQLEAVTIHRFKTKRDRDILTGGDMKLINSCSLDYMRDIPDKTFDAIVTDPPFGIGFKYNGEYTDKATPDDYWRWFCEYYSEMLRVLKDGGFMAIWQNQQYMPYFWDWFGSNIHIYAGCKNFVQLRKTPINYGYDPIVMQYKEGTPLRPNKPKRNIDFYVANTAKYVTEKNSLARKHPCPRPIDQTEIIIDNFVIEGGLVFDPFMGSGTTGLACRRNGRHFVGCEISKEYFELSNLRINKEASNGTK